MAALRQRQWSAESATAVDNPALALHWRALRGVAARARLCTAPPGRFGGHWLGMVVADTLAGYFKIVPARSTLGPCNQISKRGTCPMIDSLSVSSQYQYIIAIGKLNRTKRRR